MIRTFHQILFERTFGEKSAGPRRVPRVVERRDLYRVFVGRSKGKRPSWKTLLEIGE